MEKISKKFFWVPAMLLLVIMMWITIHGQVKVITAISEKGRIDLKEWDDSSVVRLVGEWQYFDGLMIKDLEKTKNVEYAYVPHIFENKKEMGGNPYGAATYYLHVEGLKPHELYGVEIMNVVSAYRMMVNGEDVLKAGNVSYSKDEHRPEMKEKVGYFKSNEKGSAEIFIEISNFSYNYGGFWRAAMIGREEVLSKYASHQDGVEIFLFSSILVLGFLFFGLYSINREFKPLLYFSIICILIALRTMLTNNKQFYDFIYNISWDGGTRLEFLSGYLLLPYFGFFIYSLEYVKKVKYVLWTFYSLIAASFLLMLFTPNEIYADFLPYYMDLCVASMVYFIYVIIQGIRKKKLGAGLILIGILGFIPATLVDFYGNPTYYLLPFGTYFMLIFFSIVVIRNFLQIKIHHDYLEETIMNDPLTGLKNRYFLNKLLNQGYSIHENKKLYIMFLDLDRFKDINDTYGHNVGDAILEESAKRIQNCFHRDTDIVCRYGGDEFVVFAVVKDQEGIIQQMIERIIKGFKEPFMVHGKKYSVSVSIGVAEYHKNDDLEKIINECDNAMYQAKKNKIGGMSRGRGY